VTLTRRLVVVCAIAFAATSSTLAETAPERKGLEADFDQILTTVTQNDDGRSYWNTVVLVDAPRHSLAYRGAAGLGSVKPQSAMTAEHQFYIESITKTFTATVVLQLAEEGLLGDGCLDSTLAELKLFPPEVLDLLHRIGDESYGPGITVSQLLHHTTGMKNFTYDDVELLPEWNATAHPFGCCKKSSKSLTLSENRQEVSTTQRLCGA
jgi:D-alanyl-D-alanine carboxypeptidase